MAVALGEADDLVLDRRAIARPDALDHARIHRRAVEAGPDDLVGAGVGMRDPAGDLPRVHRPPSPMNEKTGAGSSPGCSASTRKVDGAPVQARRRAGLEPSRRQLQFAQPRAQALGRRVAGAAGFVVFQADMDQARQERAGRQHHRVRMEGQADLGHDPDHPVAVQQQVVDRLLEQRQVRLVFEARPDRLLVENAVGLRAGRADRRPLAGIEDAELDAGFVGGNGHGAAQRIHFLDQVPLADAADGRVAGHLAQRFDVVGEQQRGAAHPGGRQRGLGAGMAATDDDHLETLREVHDFNK